MKIARLIHVAANGIVSFFLMAEQHPAAYTHRVCFIHSPVDELLGHFHVAAVVNSVAVNFRAHTSFQTNVFSRCLIVDEVNQR